MKKTILILIVLNLFFIKSEVSASQGVVVNEVAWAGTVASANDEWIELYNSSQEDIDLTNWNLTAVDGQPNILLSGVIAAGGYFLLERTDDLTVSDMPADLIYSGSLSNAGEKLELKNAEGIIVDFIDCAAGWFAGDNSTKASMQREGDNWTTFNSSGSHKDAQGNSLLGTPKTKNAVLSAKPAAMPESTPTTNTLNVEMPVSNIPSILNDALAKINISEIYPNPPGVDTDNEFIEIFNEENREINLMNWRIEDEGRRSYVFKDNLIKPRAHLVIYRKESKISLNNSSETLKLYAPNQTTPEQIIKYEKAPEGQSYVLEDDEWMWSKKITPAETNAIEARMNVLKIDFEAPSQARPGEAVHFDGSDLEDEKKLKFMWDFGDGSSNSLANPSHVFLKESKYKVRLTVNDGENQGSKEKEIIIKGGTHAVSVLINEIYPNPPGDDRQQEYVELFNKSKEEVNLKDWKLENGNGQVFVFEDLWLEAESFYLIKRSESKIILNNNAGSLKLNDNNGELKEEISYKKAREGEAYARENLKWVWTKRITPGGRNEMDYSDISPAKIKKIPVSRKKVLGFKVSVMPLEKAREQKPGAYIKTSGIVAVPPGIFGSQYFYIVGSPGIQVYNYKKEFPKLQVGDYVEVSGEITESAGEKRIKTKNLTDVVIIEKRKAPEPTEIKCEDIDENRLGQLVKINAKLTEKKGASLYIDDGTEEALVYLKKAANIDTGRLKEGESITITGIVSKTETGLRVLPRFMEDIFMKGAEAAEMPGQRTINDWSLEGRNKKGELFQYLLIISGVIIISLLTVLVKTRNK